ncbi:1,4-alpha-glucan branching protein GlgB [Gilvimarinus sp. SDUM040013]|uniref:1,4-alpha-glucan branching enzyme GlgB n=1 Tax=Gilvimarinus gilvus TaxID=3058038 RepID=A0ABU4RYF4_9GAMM|nr:1,4-alpha-glucan branching protein GlgB [Gilvimarinus sp. SDUM040013]MDO3385595.1 1,4-alpha-glucan branching protein GlgB [Gilvimarinus sp. SDUM040013]MDX6849929.1 1,4-alpha-glucan branching protein GlgB [Gilvimarinus sp. SDUM040013]
MTRPKGLHINTDMQRISAATHHDPFSVLGRHSLPAAPNKPVEHEITVYLPGGCGSAEIETATGFAPLQHIPDTDFYTYRQTEDAAIPEHYVVRWRTSDQTPVQRHDPYTFAPQISDYDLHLFAEGRHWDIYRLLGAQPKIIDGIAGVLFATWAPGAERVSITGDFNQWDGRFHPMRSRGSSGIWELFIPGLHAGDIYKFEIRSRENGQVCSKTDPYGRQFELRPATAAVIDNTLDNYEWHDELWMQQRSQWEWTTSPLSVYEVHLGSWRRGENGAYLNYRDLAEQIVSHVKPLGFTHVEILPISEHPLDDSWGYQCTGYFAPTSRFGNTDDFRYFVDYLHRYGLGVILDWVPAHFPKDEFSLSRFDGTALYEHEDPRMGEHKDWGTLIFNYGRNEVQNFLIASALFWLKEFHIDGLRVDAVASMLHLDYSRDEGEWIPNRYGGNENLEAVSFIRELNIQCHGSHPGALVIAEESTAWPQVSGPVYLGGLGFSLKWNMGWMHDTLEYMSKDPIYRQYHHDSLTFGMMYAYTENFQLPFSHDEVVHGKGSMINKMPGDYWQQFANLRLLYTYQFTYPGSKLLFMGCEFGQWDEWRDKGQLDWALLGYDSHAGLQKSLADINNLYRQEPALHALNYDHGGFEWIDCHDNTQSVVSYVRRSADEHVIVILNFTPTPRQNYRVGVPSAGEYYEIFNSDSQYYGGSNVGNGLNLSTESTPWMNQPHSIEVTLPPLAGIVLKCR